MHILASKLKEVKTTLRNWAAEQENLSKIFQEAQKHLSNTEAKASHCFITLVPKRRGATIVRNFRFISCSNVTYKVVSKILSISLKHVLPELVSENQYTGDSDGG